ncbi:MAG: hypothetical protein HYZ90_02550 [Candidatus Omnitrophica bacterium]|nr:hypothetical protein [Candidatus Omnitrophota bacterium]
MRSSKAPLFGAWGLYLLAGALSLPHPAAADPGELPAMARGEPPRAMWVWDARIAVQTEARNRLLAFCRSHRIGTVYLSAYNLKPPMDRSYRDFNRLAHRLGISVHALGGDPRWGVARYHHIPLQWAESVRQLNAQASSEERFDGLHSDVEVYLLSKSWNESPGKLLGAYLDMNAKIHEALQAAPDPIAFGVDIPFWFDDDPSYRIVWQGQAKPPSYHVLDTVDFVTVMAYRNFAEGSDGTIRLVSLEMDYADQIGKKVVIGQETQADLFPAYVTFGGTSCPQMKRELKKIRDALNHRNSFGGFAIHHYESYRKLCRD